jgi:hypothetical protein
MHLTEAHAAEIEADCLDALEYLSGNRAISKDSILDAMQPKRSATRSVLEAAIANNPLASLVEDTHPGVQILLMLESERLPRSPITFGMRVMAIMPDG